VNKGKPVFRKANLLYEREEKDGYLTFLSKLHPETREMIVNKTAKTVLELCNGERDIEQNIAECESIYPGVSKERLHVDANQILGACTRLGVIEWMGDNPFLNKREEPIGEGYSLSVAQEDDISRIEVFLQTTHSTSKGGSSFHHESAVITEGEYSKLALRQKLFSYGEEVFLLEREQKIEGLVAISAPYYSCGRAAIVKLLYCPANYARKLLEYVQDYFPRLCARAVTKIEVCESTLHPLDEGLKKLLAEEGFVNEASLKDELGFGEDMIIWSRVYPQDFIDGVNKQRENARKGKEVNNEYV
jgi:hypothetical protein